MSEVLVINYIADTLCYKFKFKNVKEIELFDILSCFCFCSCMMFGLY